MIHLIRASLAVLLAVSPAIGSAQWISSGRDAMFTMYLPQANKPDTHAIFIISYEKRWSCRPSVSVILMIGRKLGAPENQVMERKREDQLSIVVDGNAFTTETKVTKYSNGMEFAMFAPPGLVDAMKLQPRSVVARIGAGLGGFDFSDGKGFAAANTQAAANCS